MDKKEDKKNPWLKYTGDKKEELFDFCKGYIDYMSLC